MRAGFIGLGNLGRAMAGRLAAEGVELIVWNRTGERAAAFTAARRHRRDQAASPAALIGQVPVVLLSLADSDAVEIVLRGSDGLLAGDCRDKLIIDTTTNHPAPVLLFHELCRQRGARYVEAPVAGSVVPASAGKLVVMASGESAGHRPARPLAREAGHVDPRARRRGPGHAHEAGQQPLPGHLHGRDRRGAGHGRGGGHRPRAGAAGARRRAGASRWSSRPSARSCSTATGRPTSRSA
jgi:3-hydroxyisobutyrate dehydrogenase-like beta-hydroxyacid dehydrogenase